MLQAAISAFYHVDARLRVYTWVRVDSILWFDEQLHFVVHSIALSW
jgi:hypothetical protein